MTHDFYSGFFWGFIGVTILSEIIRLCFVLYLGRVVKRAKVELNRWEKDRKL